MLASSCPRSEKRVSERFWPYMQRCISQVSDTVSNMHYHVKWQHTNSGANANVYIFVNTFIYRYRFLNSGLWAGRASAATRLLTAVVKQVTESTAGMKTNDQELVSDMYIKRQHNISLDFYARVFQCMHETGSKPLPDCNPWKHMRESGGVWKNEFTHTTPAVFHFNGGGKKHHLEMEARAWYKQKIDSAADTVQVYSTKLRFNGKMREFRDICPKHLERTAALGGHENRPRQRKG